MTTETLTLHICVNDPDNGNFTGEVDGIEFNLKGQFGTLLKLDGYARCSLPDAKHLKISRKAWPTQGYGTWVGNWCWDAAVITKETAAEIANYLRQSGRWQPEEGWTRIWEKWKSGEPFTAEDFSVREADKE